MGRASIVAVEAFKGSLGRSSSEVTDELEAFEKLLRKWQVAQNLVSRETLPEFWTRHIADSLQVLPLLRSEDRRLLDLGSGGGLPLIPIAIGDKGNGRFFCAVEANQRKVSFLRTVSRSLELGLIVHNSRIENLVNDELGQFDVITARALANLGQLFDYSIDFLSPDGRLILHKGREYVEEVESARDFWQFDMVKTTSQASADGVLLEISKLSRKG
jgi:16S rRNA (guanine527-N7)-methyltransferase